MLKLFLHFHLSLLRVNIPVSIAASLIGMSVSANKAVGFIDGFGLLLVTGGFVVAVYIQETWYGDQYYFYHNRGLSRLQLLIGSFAVNFSLFILLFVLKMSLYA